MDQKKLLAATLLVKLSLVYMLR